MSEKYSVLNFNNEQVYIRLDKQNQLKDIDATIFDCDGVLIDIRDSYNRAIAKTVDYIFRVFLERSIPESLVSDDLIFRLRKSGGFNNDWDAVYGILMFVLCNLPERTVHKIRKHIERAKWQSDPFRRLFSVKEVSMMNSELDSLDEKFFGALIDRLIEFTELLDMTGVESVDKNLARVLGNSEDCLRFHEILKNFLYDKGGVGKGIIATVFEEFFCGSKLFLETYGIKPRFYEGQGTIENERTILQPETLDKLASIFGKESFGVASGSKIEPARHSLGSLLNRFNPESLVFLDDVEKVERELSNKGDFKGNLKKPSPFALFKASRGFHSFKFALCVGDSAEDVMMVKEAIQTDPRFLSAGVYRYSRPKDEIIRSFLDLECDLILPSVNELPLVLKKISGEKS